MDGATNDTTSVAAGVLLWDIALNPVTNKIYAANAGSSNLTVIDGATNATVTVNTGAIPCAIAVDSEANRVYAVNYASDTLPVIYVPNRSVLAPVLMKPRPYPLVTNSLTPT